MTPPSFDFQLPIESVADATLHPIVEAVTERVVARSRHTRARYLKDLEDLATLAEPHRSVLGCATQAHGFAACGAETKLELRGTERAQLGIVTSYNDMLSAHQPFAAYPPIIKRAAKDGGAIAQVAGGVPAMCDGITQGYPGMELSLFSREVIAMSTAIALSHGVFDGVLMLGVCDKIVPGLLIGALQFGHLPAALVPAGPMGSGMSNPEKKRIRNLYVEGRVGLTELMDAEAASYHSPGTCTFYGTANSNQVVVEVMGIHLPSTAFVSPNTDLRDALTRATTQRVAQLTHLGSEWLPIGRLISEKSIVNAVVALLATGGSTNHTMHLVAIAAAAGIELTWDDIDALSSVVPLIARIYPNGPADVNQFHAAGGTAVLIGELLDAGLLHEDVETIAGHGLSRYRNESALDEQGRLIWRRAPNESRDFSVLSSVTSPFDSHGGLRTVSGDLGRAVVKTSAVEDRHLLIEAPARVFDHQDDFDGAFQSGELDHDVVIVVRFQGPQANGMPELHKLVPAMSVLQARGYQVALVTDGRMSGASGTVPAAIHVTPEAAAGGPLSRVIDGDIIRLDARAGRLDVLVDELELRARPQAPTPASPTSVGRQLFASMRAIVGPADRGASIFDLLSEDRSVEQELAPA
jgi:phosphogluconate dehydratase